MSTTATYPTATALDSFGKRLAGRRKAAGLSQKQLAQDFGTAHSTIGKYGRDGMKPSVEAAKRLAVLLDTTMAYLLREPGADLLADAKMMRRLRDMQQLPGRQRESLLMTVDYFIKASKFARL